MGHKAKYFGTGALKGGGPGFSPVSTPLNPLPLFHVTSLFNIYVRELENVISNCVHGVYYAVVGKDGVMNGIIKQGFYIRR